MKALREITVTKDCQDLKGIGISKGTILHVMKEGPRKPFGDHSKILVVRVDNGTGHLDLMPETAVNEVEIA